MEASINECSVMYMGQPLFYVSQLIILLFFSPMEEKLIIIII